jgi:hypothetical protein
MRAWFALFVLLHAAAASAQTGGGLPAGLLPAALQGGVVRGRVVADDTGAPIAGARVAVAGFVIHTRSDADGRFELPLAIPGRVAVDFPGYARVLLPPTATADDVSVRLVRAAALTVQIINQQGEPVAGTNVRIACGNGASSGASNDLGQRRDAHLQPGPCTVNVGNVGAWIRLAGEPTLDQIGTAFAQLRSRASAATAAAAAEAIAVDLRAGEEASIVLLDAKAPPQSTVTIFGEARRLPSGGGSVRGRIEGPGRRPVEGASVTLSNADGILNTSSGPSGAYVFNNVPAGRFKVRASRPGLVTREYGQPAPGTQGRDVDLRDDAQLSGIDIPLTRGNVITGTVSGDGGQPLEGIGVQLFQFDDAPGRTRTISSLPVVTSTDDRGRFRLPAQAPGRYYVGAVVIGARYAAGPVYFPGRVEIRDATPIRVEAGLDIENVDIRFSPSIGKPILGTALASDGQPLEDGIVQLTGGDSTGAPVLPRTSEIRRGQFEFQNIPAGQYILSVRSPGSAFVSVTIVNGQTMRSNAPVHFGRAGVLVGDAPPAPIVIRTSAGSTIAGRIELEGSASGVTPASFALAAYPANGSGGTPGGSFATIADDWTFRIEGLGEPAWFSFTGPPGWWLKSLSLGGLDGANGVVPFGRPEESRTGAVAVFSNTAGEVAGTVSDGQRTMMNYLVVVFPIDEAGWRPQSQLVKVGRPNQSGAFSISLPPGEYWITAVDAAGLLGRQMLTTLKPFSEHIVVRDSERVQKNLRLNRPPR